MGKGRYLLKRLIYIIFVFFDLLDEHIEVCYTAPVLYNSLGLIGFELFQSTDIIRQVKLFKTHTGFSSLKMFQELYKAVKPIALQKK